MTYWYIMKLLNSTWIILKISLSVSSILNCINHTDLDSKKKEFEKCQIKCFGHKISIRTVLVDPAKIKALHTWTEPSCMH